MIRFMAVLLPAPVRPTSATISPLATENDRSRTASAPANWRVTLTSSISADGAPDTGLLPPPRPSGFDVAWASPTVRRFSRAGKSYFDILNAFSIFRCLKGSEATHHRREPRADVGANLL